MTLTIERVRHAIVAVAATLVLAAPGTLCAQATRYDPRLQFRSLTTARFEIHFHQGEEALARRLARVAEEVAADVDARLGAPRRRVHVILVDQTDQSNGWATVIPYNIIELTAAPPPPHSIIGNTDDWLRMVFAHEYTHVVHLEKSGGWLGSLRRVFGRLPVFHSNLTLPDWQIEGIATQQESAVTRRGRIAAGDFRMILQRAAAADRFPPLDRATGAVIDWPSGTSPYLFGGFFHDYLARKYGEESLARLGDETASRLPFLGSRAFRDVYGRSLGELWRDFRDDALAAAGGAGGGAPEARTRITRHGFTVTSPLFARDGRLFYSVVNPHGFPALLQFRADQEPRHVATRYRGNRLAQARDALVFDQLELVSQIGLQSDLYAVPMSGADSRRLTRGARAADPDVAPDGQTIVCTVQETGRRTLATLTMPLPGETGRPAPLVSESDTEFGAPRWSPDGRLIAAERQRLGGPSEIVIVDSATRAVRTLVASTPARNILPTWLPDGSAVLFSSDREGGAFTLYAADVATGATRRVNDAGPGAQAATLSPDGRRLVFAGYDADGYDLYSLPFEPARWETVTPPRAGVPEPSREAASGARETAFDARAYRPWPSLRPRFWLPVIEADGDDVVLGAATGGTDALGRHVYAAAAGWSLDRNRPDVQFDYTYARWWPALFASIATDTDASRIGELRSRELLTGAVFPLRRVRWNSTALAALFVSSDAFDCTACQEPADSRLRRSALRAGWRLSSAKTFGYSISQEEGTSLTIATEVTRRALGADANATALTADVRHYFPAYPRHAVIASRVAAAGSWGNARLRRPFSAGGSGPQPGGFDVDLGAIGLLRGVDESDAVGDRAAVLNVDYRFPLAWVQRGVGTWPVFLRSIHGAVFADAGHAWDRSFRAADVRRAFGAELSFDTVFGSAFGATITAGVAWRDDGDRGRVVAFGRLGRAF